MKHLNQRLTLIGIALLFFGPLVIATLMQSDWWDYRPVGMRNAGLLVQPPVPLPTIAGAISTGQSQIAVPLQAHWTLLYQVNGNCALDCINDVTRLRQLHKATGRHIDRIRVVLLRGELFPDDMSSELKIIYPQFQLLQDSDGQTAKRLQTASERALRDAGNKQLNGTEPGWIWLLDPLGNVMLAYIPGQGSSDIRKDLKRLLTYSKVDDS
jgi:hypothetical protein